MEEIKGFRVSIETDERLIEEMPIKIFDSEEIAKDFVQKLQELCTAFDFPMFHAEILDMSTFNKNMGNIKINYYPIES